MTGNCKCNFKNWLVSTVVVAAVYFGLDWVINNNFMAGVFQANSQYLRGPEQIAAMQKWVYAYYLVFAALFTCLYAVGHDPQKPKFAQGVRFGIFIGLFYWGTTILGMYPYVPWTDDFYVKWFVWGMVDAVVLGVITALLHKPKAA